MDKKTLGITGIIILLIGGGLTYVSLSKMMDSPSIEKSGTTAPSAPQTKVDTSDEAPTQSVSGKYVDYSSKAVASTPGTKLLFFHAPWCPQCRALEASIKASTLPDNITIFKVDYDSHQELRQKYGVTLQTTIVKVDAAGEKVKSYVAYGEPTFESVERELLP